MAFTTAAENVVLINGEASQLLTYHPTGGADKEVRGVLDISEESEERTEHNERLYVRRATLWILTDATAGIAAPQLTDQFTDAEGTRWAIVTFGPRDGLWEAQCSFVFRRERLTGRQRMEL